MPTSTSATDTASILDRLFKSVEKSTNGQPTLASLFDYMDYVVKNLSLKPIITELEKQKELAHKELFKLKEKTLEELKIAKGKILKIITDNKINNPELEKLITDLHRFETRDGFSMSGLFENNYDNFLDEICKNLRRNNHQDLIKEFEEVNNPARNIYGTYSVSDTIALMRQEKARIDQLKQVEIWHCWYVLKFVPEISKITFAQIMQSGRDLPYEDLPYYISFMHLKETTANKQGSYTNLDGIYLPFLNCLTRLHNYFIMKLAEDGRPTEEIIIGKLKFYSKDGVAEFKGVDCQYNAGTKAYELLYFLNTSKNTPLELKYFQDGCNNKIRVEKYKFKEEKDILDTIARIKKKLKVSNGEFFPIFKRGNSFIWEEK